MRQTDAPIIVKTQKLTASASDVVSLAQGNLLDQAPKLMLPCASPSHVQSASASEAVMLSTAAGIVHWKPPPQAMDAVVASAGDHSLNQYGSGAGLPALVKALQHKLATQNGLDKVQSICIICTRKLEQPLPA